MADVQRLRLLVNEDENASKPSKSSWLVRMKRRPRSRAGHGEMMISRWMMALADLAGRMKEVLGQLQ